jgi:hypothetical protein
MENEIVGDNEHTVIEGSVSVVDRQDDIMGSVVETPIEQEPAEVVLDMTDEREQERNELDTKLKQMIDESVHYYLSQMKEIFMTELITHLLDQKRKYEMEDNEFNKLTDDEKKKVNSFIKELTK